MFVKLCKSSGLLPVFILLVMLVLFQDVLAQPVVVTQPQDTSVCVESSAGFSIIAVNTIGYQWQENDGVGWYDLDFSFTYVEGEYTPSLTIIDANLALNEYQYRCIVNDVNNDRDTSMPATLGVNEAPIITSEPLNQRVCKGDLALFSVNAINATQYQWLEFSGVAWQVIEDNSFYIGAQTADLSVYTVIGMDGYLYRCITTNISCPDTSDIANLNVDATPIAYSVTGGGEYCDGGQGVNVGLNQSEIGIKYNLLRNGVETGIVMQGTGQSLDFGVQQLSGIYTVVGYNLITSCSDEMNGNAIINVNPLPVVYTLEGGGEACYGEHSGDILLQNSEVNNTYSLFRNSAPTGINKVGTGFPLNFGSQSQSGQYNVLATDNTTQCSSYMDGEVNVVIHTLPEVYAGSDVIIPVNTSTILVGEVIGGSVSFSYNWQPYEKCQTPQLLTTDIFPLPQSTMFMFKATDLETQCGSENDTVFVFTSGDNLSLEVSSSSLGICNGETVNLLALPSGGTGNYTYSWTSSPVGFTSTDISPLAQPVQPTTYYVEVYDGGSYINDSIFIHVSESPLVFNITGGGDFCFGDAGVEIGMDSSEAGLPYRLYHFPNSPVVDVVGSGNELSFGYHNIQGDYYVVANAGNTCEGQMNGVANIDLVFSPEANAGDDIIIDQLDQTVLSGSAIGGSGIYNYSWTPADSLINPLIQEPITIPLHSTTLFNLSVTDDETGCISADDQSVVFVYGGPLILDVSSSSEPICEGEQTNLYALASGGLGNYTFVWTSDPPGFSSTNYNPVVQPNVTTKYIVVIDDGSDTLTDSIVINVVPAPTPFITTGGGMYCDGNNGVEILLDGSSDDSMYELISDVGGTGIGLSGSGDILNFGLQVNEGYYWIVGTDNNSGCSASMEDTVQVEIASLPNKFQLYGGGTYCENDPTLDILLESSEYEVNYELYKDAIPTGSIRQGNGLPLNFTNFSGTGNYSVIATNTETSCMNTMIGVASLLFLDKPDVTINGNNQVCEGDSTILTGSGAYSYEWNTIPTQYTPSIIVSPVGFTSYTLLGNSSNGCSDTANHVVELADKPVISVVDDPISLAVVCYPNNLSNYAFYIGDVLLQEGSLNSWYYGELGLINDTITVIAENESGCMDQEELLLEMKEPPNAFTPNGDGKNDIFLEGHDISVFSSWGGEIFKGDSGWDGKHNGSLVVPGTYYYIHNIYNADGTIIKTIKGSVTVVVE